MKVALLPEDVILKAKELASHKIGEGVWDRSHGLQVG